MKKHFWALFSIVMLVACTRNFILIHRNWNILAENPTTFIALAASLLLVVVCVAYLADYLSAFVKK
jgi:hypothetical protein